jgi:hypothetical protein
MIQVIFEDNTEWPETGPAHIVLPRTVIDAAVSPQIATRRATGYLGGVVGMGFRPGTPSLVASDPPRWRMPIVLHLRGLEPIAMLDTIEVDARTGHVTPLPLDQIRSLQDHAGALALRLASAAAEPG